MGTTNYGIEDPKVKYNAWLENECGHVLYQKTNIIYFPARLMMRLIPIIKKVDIIHLTSFFYPLSWLTSLWITLSGNKSYIIWSVRGELQNSALSFGSVKKKIMLAWMRRAFKNRVVFHSTSDEETKSLYAQFGKAIRVIQLPNYIYLPSQLHAEITKTILFLGRIHPIKGIENLISGFAGIAQKNGFTLVIAGDDNNKYADSIKIQCKILDIDGSVLFTGHVDGLEKEHLLSSAYVVVLPSYSENFGNVVIEALAQGTPVIASSSTPWEILEQVQQGTWVPNDPESLRVAIEKIISLDNESYSALRRRSYTLCKENFSIIDNIQKWEDAYHQVIHG